MYFCNVKLKKYMERFNIQRAVEYYNLDADEASKVLFPEAKHPKKAFERVMAGRGSLSTRQVEDLASYIGVGVADLFLANAWKGLSEDGRLVLTKGPYRVTLNYGATFFSLYKSGELIEKAIINPSIMPISQFINHINIIIKTYENGND